MTFTKNKCSINELLDQGEKKKQKTSTVQTQDLLQKKTSLCNQEKTEVIKKPITRIVINYDVGFSNALYIRGRGANLSWEKGVVLKNIKPDEWVWETRTSFTTCEFKILLNDKEFEIGDNHLLSYGTTIQYTPKF